MDQAAADKVKQIREYLSKMTPGDWRVGGTGTFVAIVAKGEQHTIRTNHSGGTYPAADAHGIAALRTDAEWLLSQLSASEERVRGLEGAIRNVIEASVNDADCCTVCGCDATFHCSDCAIERAESLLPSPPQVIRG